MCKIIIKDEIEKLTNKIWITPTDTRRDPFQIIMNNLESFISKDVPETIDMKNKFPKDGNLYQKFALLKLNSELKTHIYEDLCKCEIYGCSLSQPLEAEDRKALDELFELFTMTQTYKNMKDLLLK